MLDEAAVRAAAAAVDPDEVVRFAQALVAAPSENPPGGEEEAASVAAGILSAIGASPETLEAEPGRTNVLARLGSGRPKLVWNGHLDVVPAGDAEDWLHPPFRAVVEGGRLWGRGTADMKGPMAAALAAGAAIVRAGVDPRGTLEYHLVADEEHSGIFGTRVLRDKGLLDADACVVGEPTALDLGLAQRGGAWMTATAIGKAAHGSQPDLGRNAIVAMSRFVLALPRVLPDVSHPLVGRPTVSVGTMLGGRARNVVPDRCEAVIDRRIIPGETEESVREPLDRLLESLRADDPDLSLTVEIAEWTEPAETPPRAAIADIARRAVRDERGSEPRDIGFTGITDARFYINDAGIPAVVLGPGDLSVAHALDEFVPIDELVSAARIYAALFVRFLGA